VAYIYSPPVAGVLDDGAWFTSKELYGGCPPQGSFWTSPEELADLLWDMHNGFFVDDRMLPMITAYGSSADLRWTAAEPLPGHQPRLQQR
jgi:hypothetical protein